MKTNIARLLTLTGLFLVAGPFAREASAQEQSGYFKLRATDHGDVTDTDRSKSHPYTITEFKERGGEFRIVSKRRAASGGAGDCIETYRFVWNFNKDVSVLRADETVEVTVKAELKSPQCLDWQIPGIQARGGQSTLPRTWEWYAQDQGLTRDKGYYTVGITGYTNYANPVNPGGYARNNWKQTNQPY